jgi:hypothetical protein
MPDLLLVPVSMAYVRTFLAVLSQTVPKVGVKELHEEHRFKLT